MCIGVFGVLPPEMNDSRFCSFGVVARFSLDREALLSCNICVMVPLVPGRLPSKSRAYVGPKSILGTAAAAGARAGSSTDL